MTDQFLESRVARLESAVAHIVEKSRREQFAAADRKWRRAEIAFHALMLLLNAIIVGALVHGFK
jgi:hypothetical protein